MQEKFQNWKKNYRPSFRIQQEFYRKIIFYENLQIIRQHNKDTTSPYKMGINKFTIYTDDEFKAQYLSNIKIQSNLIIQNKILNQQIYPNIQIDWTTKGKVTSVKDQGVCGACWAFSATAVAQSWSLISRKELLDLSEQQLIDCSSSYGNQGCNGGLPSFALKYIIANGIVNQSQYPYLAKNGPCKKNGGDFKIPKSTNATGCASMQLAIAGRPISVTVDATNWSKYSSGVFNNCGSKINHAVLLVGIVDNSWKIKNSWGLRWGQLGYMRIASGNTCAICSLSSVYVQ